MATYTFIESDLDFERLKNDISRNCRMKSQLPEQVFNKEFSFFTFEEFDWAMSSELWPEVQRLGKLSGDSSLLIAVIDPDPKDYYKKEFGFYNWAILPISASACDYWSLLNQHPLGSPADSLLLNSEKVVWMPSSGQWIIWGQRSFGVCVLACQKTMRNGLWKDVQWALEVAMPNYFRGGIIPRSFIEKLQQNYSAPGV